VRTKILCSSGAGGWGTLFVSVDGTISVDKCGKTVGDRRPGRKPRPEFLTGGRLYVFIAPVHSLRIDGESDVEFRRRAERAGRTAHVLVEAGLANRCIQDFIHAPEVPYTVETVRRGPDVRMRLV